MGGRESSKGAVLVVQVGGNEVLTWLLAEGIESKAEMKWLSKWLIDDLKFINNMDYHKRLNFPVIRQ